MKAKLSLVVVASICSIGAARAQQTGTAEIERYIRESERQWAETVFNGNTSIVDRILADAFLGVDPDRLNDVKVRFFGDTTAVAQGDETWVRRTVLPLRARFVWTDTWILRNGKWQIVASEDLIAPRACCKTLKLKLTKPPACSAVSHQSTSPAQDRQTVYDKGVLL